MNDRPFPRASKWMLGWSLAFGLVGGFAFPGWMASALFFASGFCLAGVFVEAFRVHADALRHECERLQEMLRRSLKS